MLDNGVVTMCAPSLLSMIHDSSTVSPTLAVTITGVMSITGWSECRIIDVADVTDSATETCQN